MLLQKLENHYKIYGKDIRTNVNGFGEKPIEKNGLDELGSDTDHKDGEEEIKSKKKGLCVFRICTRIQLNRAAIITLPILSLIFYVYYFIFTTKAHISRELQILNMYDIMLPSAQYDNSSFGRK